MPETGPIADPATLTGPYAYVLAGLRDGRPEAWVAMKSTSGHTADANGSALTREVTERTCARLERISFCKDKAISHKTQRLKTWVQFLTKNLTNKKTGLMGPYVELVEENRFAEVGSLQGYRVESVTEALSRLKSELDTRGNQ